MLDMYVQICSNWHIPTRIILYISLRPKREALQKAPRYISLAALRRDVPPSRKKSRVVIVRIARAARKSSQRTFEESKTVSAVGISIFPSSRRAGHIYTFSLSSARRESKFPLRTGFTVGRSSFSDLSQIIYRDTTAFDCPSSNRR